MVGIGICSASISSSTRCLQPRATAFIENSISMRGKSTSSSLVGKKFILLIAAWGTSTCRTESSKNLISSTHLRLTEYFEHRSVCTSLTLLYHSNSGVLNNSAYSYLQVENLYLKPPSWYVEQQPHRFRYHLSETVTYLSPRDHLVYTSKGRSFKHDKCILTTGSTAN